MTERVRFHFDPLCPWAWQGSRWIREVEKVRDVEVEWRLFSLELVNEGREDPLADAHRRGTPALRTLAFVRREVGNEGIGALYKALGERTHDRNEQLDVDAVRAALDDVGFDPGLVDKALADGSTMEEVRAEHEAAVAEVGAFGVPTIVLPSGRGMFGPVLATAPVGDAAGDLWDHVAWVIDQDGLYELKRERDRKPGSR